MNYIDEFEREKAHSDAMTAMAAHWMERHSQLERTLAIVVHAAGGEVVVHRDDVSAGERLALSREERMDDLTWRFRSAPTDAENTAKEKKA